MPYVFPYAWPLIEKAVNRFRLAEPTTITQVAADLTLNKAQLWVALDCRNERLLGVVVTAIQTDTRFPGCKYVHCKFCGGERLKDWMVPLWMMLKEWGRSHGCTHMMVPGRAGWSRLLGLEYLFTNEHGIRVYVRSLREN